MIIIIIMAVRLKAKRKTIAYTTSTGWQHQTNLETYCNQWRSIGGGVGRGAKLRGGLGSDGEVA